MKYDDEKCLVILDKYQEAIEDAVSYAVITSSEDLYHEDEDEIIRAIFISRGENTYHMTFGVDGWIYSSDRNIPRQLLIDVHNVIADTLYGALAHYESEPE